jgi:hypothetical protein
MNYAWVSAGESVTYRMKLGIHDNGDYAPTSRMRNAVKHRGSAVLNR